jgi:hypothetical protein
MNKFENCILNLKGPQNAPKTFNDFVYIITSIQTWNHPKHELEEITKDYTTNELSVAIPKIYEILQSEMLLNKFSINGNDFLGSLYEKLFLTNDDNRMLTWNQCKNLKKIPQGFNKIKSKFAFVDVGCRSGRIILQEATESKSNITYIGIEYDLLLAQICALNLLISGFLNSEVILVDRDTHEFKGCYKVKPCEHKNLEWVTDIKHVHGWQGYLQYLVIKGLAH